MTVARGTPCLGPVTQAGCGVLCPTYDRGCYGCFGPSRQPNLLSIANYLMAEGTAPRTMVELLRNFNGYAPEFRAASERIEAQAETTHGG